MKRCPACELDRKHADFNRDRSRADGLQQYCRACYRMQKRTHWPSGRKKRRS